MLLPEELFLEIRQGFNRNIMGCKCGIEQIVDARIKDLIGT